MDYSIIATQFETEIETLFAEIRSGIAEREDSRAFGSMIERKITDNWQTICTKLGFEAISLPGRRTIFDFACIIDGKIWGFDVKSLFNIFTKPLPSVTIWT